MDEEVAEKGLFGRSESGDEEYTAVARVLALPAVVAALEASGARELLFSAVKEAFRKFKRPRDQGADRELRKVRGKPVVQELARNVMLSVNARRAERNFDVDKFIGGELPKILERAFSDMLSEFGREYWPGDWVRFKTARDIEALVVGLREFGASLEYLVTWMSEGNRQEAWVSVCEVERMT